MNYNGNSYAERGTDGENKGSQSFEDVLGFSGWGCATSALRGDAEEIRNFLVVIVDAVLVSLRRANRTTTDLCTAVGRSVALGVSYLSDMRTVDTEIPYSTRSSSP